MATVAASWLAEFEASLIAAMLYAESVVVPCAYSTMGRGPVQGLAVPVGTISAPEAICAELSGATVQYLK